MATNEMPIAGSTCMRLLSHSSLTWSTDRVRAARLSRRTKVYSVVSVGEPRSESPADRQLHAQALDIAQRAE